MNQVVKQGANVLPWHVLGQFPAAAFPVNQYQQATHQGRQAQGAGLDFLLTQRCLGKNGRSHIERHIGHGTWLVIKGGLVDNGLAPCATQNQSRILQ